MNSIKKIVSLVRQSASGKKMLALAAGLATILAVSSSGLIPSAHAAITVTAAPVALITSTVSLPASSAQTALFSFSLSADSGETLSAVSAQLNAANGSTIVGSHIGSLSLYKDDGSNTFSPVSGNLVGSQTTVNIGSPTTITPATTTPATGKFYISLGTSASWSGTSPVDSITATLPSNGITASANSPITSAVTTAAVNAQTSGPVLVSAVAQNTGGGAAKEAGDTVALTFSEATNEFAVNTGNINSQFILSNGHSFLDSSGNFGGASWNGSGTILTIILSGSATTTPSLASVALGDTVTMSGSTGITDNLANKATGQPTITGNFGSQLTPGVTTAIYNPAEATITSAASGSIVHDSATVTGNGSIIPTGSIIFNFFDNINCSATPAQTSGSFNLANGYVDGTTFAQGPLAAGSYSFMATYSGDGNYVAQNSACEPLTITQTGAISIATQLSATAVATGTPVYDSATLANFTANAGGSVTYNVYAGEVCSGTPVFSDTEAVTNGVVGVSKDFTPTATGTYYWQAVYSGDANNSGVSSPCGSEALTVTATAPSTQTCSNGITNGKIYKEQDNRQFLIGVNCTLQPYTPQTSTTGSGKGRKPFNFISCGQGFGRGNNPGSSSGQSQGNYNAVNNTKGVQSNNGNKNSGGWGSFSSKVGGFFHGLVKGNGNGKGDNQHGH